MVLKKIVSGREYRKRKCVVDNCSSKFLNKNSVVAPDLVLFFPGDMKF